jgi:hypothetical protein
VANAPNDYKRFFDWHGKVFATNNFILPIHELDYVTHWVKHAHLRVHLKVVVPLHANKVAPYLGLLFQCPYFDSRITRGLQHFAYCQGRPPTNGRDWCGMQIYV